MAKTVAHLVRYFLGLDVAESQTTCAERSVVAKYAAGKRRLAELGVFEGVSTAVIAQAMDAEGILYAVDPFFAVPGELDFVFIDGDHSTEGITRDWSDWSMKIAPGGVIALHDTRVPAHNPRVAELGSHHYFEKHIRHDARFAMIEQVDSLSILSRKAGMVT